MSDHLTEAKSLARERAECFDKIWTAPCGCEFVMDRSKEFGHPDREEKRCKLAARNNENETEKEG